MSKGFIPVLSFESTVTRQHYQLKLIETWAGTVFLRAVFRLQSHNQPYCIYAIPSIG